MTRIAFDISEEFDTPVLLRGQTRVSHADSLVEPGKRIESKVPIGLDRKLASKNVMVPVNTRVRRQKVEERMQALGEYAETFPYNVMEIDDPRVGFIASLRPTSTRKRSFRNIRT